LTAADSSVRGGTSSNSRFCSAAML
jgi:hypothetical protein